VIEHRLDVVDNRLESIDRRLDNLDLHLQAVEARGLDTKPIWERALVEILSVKERVENIERKFDVFSQRTPGISD
jgi:hypothetical protein